MATRISVSVKGLTGLDEPDRLVAELEAETGLAWHSEPVDEGKVLSGGIVEIILVAVAVKAAEMTLEATVDAAKGVVERWRRERLDPPEASVDTDPAPEPGLSSEPDPAPEPDLLAEPDPAPGRDPAPGGDRAPHSNPAPDRNAPPHPTPAPAPDPERDA